MAEETAAKRQKMQEPLKMLAVGFCGVDDSVTPEELLELSESAPWAEWGVLFRPEKEGTPRFASMKWVEKLGEVVKLARENGKEIRLAGHLCSTRCEEVLNGNFEFVEKLSELGFGRVQINATEANGVDVSNFANQIETLSKSIKAVPKMEFILQRNVKTAELFDPILERSSEFQNISALFDDSVGTGIELKTYTSPKTLKGVPCGYAGGIGPKNIGAVVKTMVSNVGEDFTSEELRGPWIDMESSLRLIQDGNDIFSLANVALCILRVERLVKEGLVSF